MMTQEEFYIWLLNHVINSGINLPKFNPDSLKSYEISKLFLEKFGIGFLTTEEQKYLNLDAVSNWFRISERIHLQYDIPEILELLPERIVGGLYLRNSQFQSLPKLESVGRWLDLKNSQIQSLPKLESIGGFVNLQDSQIQSLPELRSVGGKLDLENSQIQTLPNLESVGGLLVLRNSQIQFLPKLESVENSIYTLSEECNYWKRYFRETGRSHLANKVCQ